MKIERDKDRPGTWRVDLRIARRRIRERGFGTKKAAEEFISELKVQAKKGKHGLERDRPRITIDQVLEERLLDLDLTSNKGKRSERVLRSFVATLPHGCLVDEITTSDLREWAKALRRRKLKPSSINRYLSEVSGMLRAAPAMFAEIGDDWRPPKFPWEKEGGRRGSERVISADERSALLEALRFPRGRVDGKGLRPADVVARRDVADCFELALNTAMRGGEVRCLEWSEVDLVEAEIHLPGHKTKTREPRDVPLNARALEILRRRKDASRKLTRFVFPNEAGDGPRVEISRVLRPVARQLGLRYGSNLPDGFRPHSTRHTATTEMLRRGVDMKTVQDVTGHSDKIMVLRYSHSTKQSRRDAVESLASGEAGTRSRPGA